MDRSVVDIRERHSGEEVRETQISTDRNESYNDDWAN